MGVNNFVDYLNSMNNASSNTIAALAESQVLSPYYDKIQIERVIGKYISDKISTENVTVVLTGHAGDGKTSILVQVLKELGMLKNNSPLKEEEMFENNGIKLYAVKDMSELSEDKQIDFCKKALEAPKRNMSSIVISNTGPLLKCLESIKHNQCIDEGTEFNESIKSDLQTLLLNQLDSNECKTISVGDYHFIMINIARVDNVSFAEKILDKILIDELWEPCYQCTNKDKCHIYFNVYQISKYKKRVISFINAFYRYLYENDMRMTIRQMMSQLSFSITGNRTCEQINSTDSENLKFKYLFSNLFFGFCGLKEIDNADQIQGVKYARDLKLDSKGLKSDYDLFVSGNFDLFPLEIKKLIERQHQIFAKKHINFDLDDDSIFNDDDLYYRKAVRRAFIFFEQSMQTDMDIKYNTMYDDLFGNSFVSFLKMQDGNAGHNIIKKLEKIILDALYLEMTGISSKQVKEIPLTIKRNDDNFQNVMITNGHLKKSDLKIITQNNDNPFDEDSRKTIALQICSSAKFNLTLPMIIYFNEIANGVISTSANPALTHGLSRLKAELQKNTYSESDDEISILVNSTNSPMNLKLYIDNDEKKLYID